MGRKEELDAEMQRAIEHWKPKSEKGGKATYDKTNILGGSKHTEGRAASKESKKGKWR